MMNRILLCCTLLFSPLLLASEQMVVVVNKNNPVAELSKSEVIDIFMGKYMAFPDGSFASPVELSDSHDLKALFYENLIGRSVASVNAYWARLRFTGRTRVADIKATEQEVISLLQQQKLAIGYIRSSQLTDDLKVVYRFDG